MIQHICNITITDNNQTKELHPNTQIKITPNPKGQYIIINTNPRATYNQYLYNLKTNTIYSISPIAPILYPITNYYIIKQEIISIKTKEIITNYINNII